ncbi:hypothetical protein PtA15_2A314 [Puccinia triticina]|uniref:Uncharacterized protein n=1 Tax=Puccinia triticina TaxID=208348 RepID=A0ABY7CCX4_9BASI|nr:uncharacterized protein PtA15_2A314 [Puccinia triticina]WAQ82001.1 hypothetical protein PtA15_2A314 [Puccinia triticina]
MPELAYLCAGGLAGTAPKFEQQDIDPPTSGADTDPYAATHFLKSTHEIRMITSGHIHAAPAPFRAQKAHPPPPIPSLESRAGASGLRLDPITRVYVMKVSPGL